MSTLDMDLASLLSFFVLARVVPLKRRRFENITFKITSFWRDNTKNDNKKSISLDRRTWFVTDRSMLFLAFSGISAPMYAFSERSTLFLDLSFLSGPALDVSLWFVLVLGFSLKSILRLKFSLRSMLSLGFSLKSVLLLGLSSWSGTGPDPVFWSDDVSIAVINFLRCFMYWG